jgi:hypothetical protein
MQAIVKDLRIPQYLGKSMENIGEITCGHKSHGVLPNE